MEIKAIDHGNDKIILDSSKTHNTFPSLPTRISSKVLHLKRNGDINNKESFCFECIHFSGHVYFHEFTLKTLSQALNKFGFRIEKIKD